MQIPDDWMEDPDLASIDPLKLQFLLMLFQKGSSLSQKDMMPFLMSIAKQSKDNHISFEKEELQKVLKVFEKHASDAEINKIQKAMSMMPK